MIKHRSTTTKANGNSTVADCNSPTSTSTTTTISRSASRLHQQQSRKPAPGRGEFKPSTVVSILVATSLVLIIIVIVSLTVLPSHVFQSNPQHLAAPLLSPQRPSSLVKKKPKAMTTSPASSSNAMKIWNQPNSTLPQWMKDYFDWHVMTRDKITEENWESYRYMVLSCNEGERCGGVSDRLKPLPFLLWLAHLSKRLVLIHWSNRPFRLEEFVVPHAAGINWTTPHWLLPQPGPRYNLIRSLIKEYNISVSKIHVKIQTWDGGREYYEANVVPASTYAQVFSQVFASFFVPSPAVSRRLQGVMNKLQLQPGRYVVAHHRANYQHRQANETYVILASINAVNCASTMWPGVPIYFCSDSQQSLHIVQDYAKRLAAPEVLSKSRLEVQHGPSPPPPKEQQSHIVWNDVGGDAVHLDKAILNETSAAEGFYDVFVDLYLMVHAQCVSYGPGGFGRFGMLLSRNASCGLRHFYRKQLTPCHWTPYWKENISSYVKVL